VKDLKWKITMVVYPHDPEKLEVEGTIPIATVYQPDPQGPQKPIELSAEYKNIGTEIAPDKLREDMEIGVPTPVREHGIGIVDRIVRAARGGK
jgi:hypothetical protein